VWLHRDAAEALLRVQRDLRREGLGLKVFDAYRPYHVQQRMWDLIRDERYVSNPAKNAGRHTRGTAVDVTLVDRQGRELSMPTAFDDFTERAHRNAAGIPARAKANSLRLEQAMARHGFIPYPYEWWHFDYRGWEQHPPLDVSLTGLSQPKSASDVAR
jgi:D-alanyl-D-alanine dipeptidase